VEVARAESSSLIPLSATTRSFATLSTLSIETMLLPRDSGDVLRPATTVTVADKVWLTTVGWVVWVIIVLPVIIDVVTQVVLPVVVCVVAQVVVLVVQVVLSVAIPQMFVAPVVVVLVVVPVVRIPQVVVVKPVSFEGTTSKDSSEGKATTGGVASKAFVTSLWNNILSKRTRIEVNYLCERVSTNLF